VATTRFFSKKLSPTERRCSTYDRELLAAYLGTRHFVHLIEGQRTTLRTDFSNTKTLELLIDTGSDVNIIKINKLRKDLKINENNKLYLKGINETKIETIGTIHLVIGINNDKFNVEFNVVKAEFPIPKDGILGHRFLSENKAIIDICNKTMIINN
jgi:hypothetical protein